MKYLEKPLDGLWELSGGQSCQGRFHVELGRPRCLQGGPLQAHETSVDALWLMKSLIKVLIKGLIRSHEGPY